MGILVARLARYRTLRDTTVATFGEAHFAAWARASSFSGGLFVAGKLGGARIVARRSPTLSIWQEAGKADTA
jgi:hypothetical protein